MIDFETAKQLLSYNKVTGEIFWTLAAYKTVKRKKAGTLRPNGYKQICVLGKIYKEHRLVWLLAYGVFPNGQIDHINGNPLDNRIENLRDVSSVINQQNMRLAKSNSKTGLLGVKPRNNRYIARIRIGNTRKHLGTFATPEQAHEAYVSAKRQYHEGCTI